MQYKLPIDLVSNQFYGPVSNLRCKTEWERYTQVYNSIARDGLFIDVQGINNIECLTLSRKNQYKYLIVAGQHRVAALAALGRSDVTLQIRQRCLGGVIDINHSSMWPTVLKNYLAVKEAEDIFNRLFFAEQPARYRK